MVSIQIQEESKKESKEMLNIVKEKFSQWNTLKNKTPISTGKNLYMKS